jgi:eukaryotic-like serine/threonine-protein kinase
MMEQPTSPERDTAVGRGKLGWSESHWSALTAIKEPSDLACVLQADQRRRWRLGQRVAIEVYFQDFPTLAANEALAADLVFHDFCLREEFGPPPPFDEYRKRFPGLVARLDMRLLVHQLLDDSARTARKGANLASDPSVLGDDEFPQIPRYDILRELGRGGMGVVYLAAQHNTDRFVALKMILPGAEVSDEDRDRFRFEAAAMSRVQHPNLVQIYEVDEYNGLPYFSSEFVDGGCLEDKLKGQPMPSRDAARLIATLARAIHCAHRQHVFHRDLKPANVLLTSDGVPKITDFGVAKRADRGGKSAKEAVMGTPIYMAPEQARAQAEAIGAPTDIYALGAMLYELLTAVPPFIGETVQDTLLKVLYEEVVPPTRLQPSIPRPLEVIVLKCLQKEPAKRYTTGETLADDLEKFAGKEGDSGVTGWLSRWIKGG